MKRPRIKSVFAPRKRPDGQLLIGDLELTDDEHGSWCALAHLLDGTRTTAAIVAELAARFPDYDPSTFEDAIAALIDTGLVEEADVTTSAILSAAELERYGRSLEYFAALDRRPRATRFYTQERLRSAHVTIVGLGGSGSAVAPGLAASGIGGLHCVDCDVVEVGNLNRQLLYVESDVGLRKVERAVARLTQINAAVEVTGEECLVTGPEDLERVTAGSDVVVLCADRPADLIQRWMGSVAVKTGVPWFYAFLGGPMARVAGFVPGRSPCYDCFEAHRQGQVGASAPLRPDFDPPQGIIAPAVGVAGNLCAHDVLCFLGGLPTSSVGKEYLFALDAWERSVAVEIPFRADCRSCAPSERSNPLRAVLA